MRTESSGGTRNRRLLLGAVILLICALLMQLAVNWNVTLYSDDYWYGTFFEGGWHGFWEHTVDHYKTTNGRVWVHILIPILLLADTKLFAVLAPVLTAAIFLVGLRVQRDKWRPETLIFATGLGMIVLLGSEIQYLRTTLYWLAAYFNYVFPLLLPLAVLWYMEQKRTATYSKLGFAAICVCALLAGSSTEQCGLVSLILIWGGWLLFVMGQKLSFPRWRFALLPLLTSVGYLTILLAPGSHARIQRGIDGGLFSVLHPAVFWRRFCEVMEFLVGNPFWNGLFLAFCLLTALVCLVEKGRPKALLLGFPAAVAAGILMALERHEMLAVFTVLYTLYIAIVFLFVPEYHGTALLIFGAGASVMLLIVTTLYYTRTVVPCVLLMLLVCLGLLFRVLAVLPKPWAGVVCGVIAVAFFIRYIPICQGYAANRVVWDRNAQAMEDYRAGRAEELELCIDLAADYRFTTFFEGTYFLTNYLHYHGVPTDAPVRFVSDWWEVTPVREGERVSVFPAIDQGDGLLIPFEFLFGSNGNQCVYHWDSHTYSITYGGEAYRLYKNGLLVRVMEDWSEQIVDTQCRTVMPFSDTYTLLYMSVDDLSRCFGMTYTYDETLESYVFVTK